MDGRAATRTPDALVLGGGGILGEAWMSAVLSGLDEGERFDSRSCGLYLGTSAGSIVAASLATGIEPGARLGRLPEQPELDAEDTAPHDPGAGWRPPDLTGGLGGAAAASLASLAIGSTAGGGALLRRATLGRLPRGRRPLGGLGAAVDDAGAIWDGRLRITAVEIESGHRVVFGSPGAPEVSVGTAVEASCAIPGVFAPVRVDGRTYVDGGAWSPTNMDAIDVEPAMLITCLNPTGSMRPSIGSVLGALGSVSRGVAAAEALALRHRGAQVTTISPDAASAAAMGTNLMDATPRAAVIAAGLAQGRRIVLDERRRAA
jgi:NTE family protein